MPFSFKPSQEIESPVATAVVASSDLANENSPSSITSLFGFRSRLPKNISGFQMILIFIFVVLLLVTVFLFGYRWYLKTQIVGIKKDLDAYNLKFKGLPLAEMSKLSNRIKFISQLINTHPSINSSFRILEDSVENPVTYNRFDFHYEESKKTYVLQLGASAPDYRSVVQQMDTFKNSPWNKYISGVTIDGLHPDDTGKVTFSLKLPIMIIGIMPEDLVLTATTTALTSDISEPTPAPSTTLNGSISASTTLPVSVQATTSQAKSSPGSNKPKP